MRRPSSPTRTGLLAAIAAVSLLSGGAAFAGIALSPIMSSWSYNLRKLDGMLNGRTQYDAAAARAAIAVYVADASRVAARLPGNSSAERDFRQRFVDFAAEGRRAMTQASDRAALRQNVRRMAGSCQSCHDAYN